MYLMQSGVFVSFLECSVEPLDNHGFSFVKNVVEFYIVIAQKCSKPITNKFGPLVCPQLLGTPRDKQSFKCIDNYLARFRF